MRKELLNMVKRKFKVGNNVINKEHLGWGVGVVLIDDSSYGDDNDYLVAYPEANDKALHSGGFLPRKFYLAPEYKNKCFWSLEEDLISGTLVDYVSEDKRFVEVDKEFLLALVEDYALHMDCGNCRLEDHCVASAFYGCKAFLMSRLIRQIPPPEVATCLTAPVSASGSIKFLTIAGTPRVVYGVPCELQPEELVGKKIYYRERGGNLMYWGKIL